MTETKTYTASFLIPHYIEVELERPADMSEEEVVESVTFQELLNGQRDELELKDIYKADDYTLSYIEEID